jgi:8-oxo-dGTP diphosphatase
MPVAVDIVLFAIKERQLSLLLIRRGIEPFKGRWALPGGLVLEHEGLHHAAARELREEAGVRAVSLEQFGAYGEPGRDPRGRVVSIAYVAMVRADDQVLQATTDADAAAWFPVDSLPDLAFDHARIVHDAREHLRRALDREPVGFQLLPRAFSLAALQAVHEAVIGKPLDKRNFRRKVLSEELVLPLAGEVEHGSHRPAQLYRYARPLPGAPRADGEDGGAEAPPSEVTSKTSRASRATRQSKATRPSKAGRPSKRGGKG